MGKVAHGGMSIGTITERVQELLAGRDSIGDVGSRKKYDTRLQKLREPQKHDTQQCRSGCDERDVFDARGKSMRDTDTMSGTHTHGWRHGNGHRHGGGADW